MSNVESIVQELDALSEQEQAEFMNVYATQLRVKQEVTENLRELLKLVGKSIKTFPLDILSERMDSAYQAELKDTKLKTMRQFLEREGLLERKQSAGSKQLEMINQQLTSGQGDIEELLELATNVAKQHIKNVS